MLCSVHFIVIFLSFLVVNNCLVCFLFCDTIIHTFLNYFIKLTLSPGQIPSYSIIPRTPFASFLDSIFPGLPVFLPPGQSPLCSSFYRKDSSVVNCHLKFLNFSFPSNSQYFTLEILFFSASQRFLSIFSYFMIWLLISNPLCVTCLYFGGSHLDVLFCPEV